MTKKLALISIVSLVLLGTAAAMYEETDKVVKLTASNFNEEVIESEKLWFVEFYAPWCGHCKNLAPEWKKLAIGLEDMIGVGAVDMTVDGSVGQPYSISGYPTIKFFGADKTKPIDYDGGRTFDELLGWALDQLGKHATAKGSPGENYDAKHEKKEEEIDEGDPKDVIVLTEETFDEQVMGSKETWFVEFVAPWCGHCKKLAPEWNRLATNLLGQINVGKVNCVEHRTLCDKYAVKGYPSIKFFPPGEKAEDKVVDYGDGSRSSGVMESWALEKKILYEPAKFDQLVSEEIFKGFCREAKGICLITFLPHIYDTNKEERNAYLDVLKELADKYKGKPCNFLWAQGGDQYILEETLHLGSGYPTIVAISMKKSVFAVMRGRFQKEGIETFVNGIIGGRSVGVTKLTKELEIISTQPWDGEDKKPEIRTEEENYDD